MRALHLAPHPDDEILGAGATLLGLIGAGHQVTNLAVSLGRRPDRERRRGEVEDACRQLGVPLEVLEPPLDMSSGEGDDLDAAGRRLAAALGDRASDYDLLIAPSPHDGHPGHQLVGRAAVAALGELAAEAPRLWLWSLWSALPLPTTVTGFDEPEMIRLEAGLEAHRSQIERNDYLRLLRAKATVDAVLGPERVLGLGSRGLGRPYAELTCELVPSEGRWMLGAPRLLEPARPFPAPTGLDASAWLAAPTATALLEETS